MWIFVTDDLQRLEEAIKKLSRRGLAALRAARCLECPERGSGGWIGGVGRGPEA